MRNSTYLLDSNVFIEGQKHYYRFSFCPAFWDAILSGHEEGMFFSIDFVKTELENPVLKDWAKNNLPDSFFLDATGDDSVVGQYVKLVELVNSKDQYLQKAKDDFASGADGWLLAYAKVNGCTIVTHEVRKDTIRRKVPIPNLADLINVRTISTFEMLEESGVKFHAYGIR